MTETNTEQFDKLVRDRIPGIIEENGERPEVSRVSGEAYTERLVEKLHEEVEEYAGSREVEELADVLEVVHALREAHDVSRERLAEIREEKAEERGRFAEGIVLERVESPPAGE